MRIPVVDTRGVALMPCTPAKARHLFKSGKAKPKRNKLGLFYVQLSYEQEQHYQPHVAGIDPGSKFEGFSVVGTKDTVMSLMVEAPTHVKDAVGTRRRMRRARRGRKWRRPERFDNRLNRKKGGKWNSSFSPVQVCLAHLYRLMHEMGLQVHLREGWQTRALREQYGLKKTISLHDYRTNKRLTQGEKVETCRVLTWVAFRSWLVTKEQQKKSGKGAPIPSPKQGTPIHPPLKRWEHPGSIR